MLRMFDYVLNEDAFYIIVSDFFSRRQERRLLHYDPSVQTHSTSRPCDQVLFATILVKTSNRTLYIHEYNGI